MEKLKVNVSVADDHLRSMQEVVQRLKDAGLSVEQTLEGLGIVTGTVEAAKLPALSGLEGVSAVETDREVRIAPPDSDLQ